jgi:hypothetical protein
MLFLTEFTKNATSSFYPNSATCHMCDSLEGMLSLRPRVNDIMVGNNEVMSSVSIGQSLANTRT